MNRALVGIDIVEISRIKRAIERWREDFLQRVFTHAELRLCGHRFPSLAVRFAGKEAVMKALGAPKKGVSWREIEILSEPDGKPLVHLYGKAQNRAESLGLSNLAISLSHSREYAVAFVVGEKG